jgi:hypothetical protein
MLVPQLNLIRQFAKQGESSGHHPCLDGTYKDNKDAAVKFAKRQTLAAFGYSETLFDILSNAPNDGSVMIRSLNIGKAEHPLLLMDGFVWRKGLTGLQREAALRFVEYMQNPATYVPESLPTSCTPRAILPDR